MGALADGSGGSREKASEHLGEGIWEEASGRRHLGGGIWEKAAGRRHLRGGIWEEASGRTLGGALGGLSGGSGRTLGGLWEELRGLWRLWRLQACLGGSLFINRHHSATELKSSFLCCFYDVFLRVPLTK